MGKKILILGAGYGGIMTAVKLQKIMPAGQAEITLVNKHDYHYFTTSLHEPAAGTRHHDSCRINIPSVLNPNKVYFVQAQVESINPEERRVVMSDGRILDYDYLVAGLGSESETFGIQGLKEHAFSIRSINSVRMIREHIEYMFAKYRNEPQHPEFLTFVVGGAGFTGIEFIGELTDRIPILCREFDVQPSLVKIYNIEAAPTALPGFDPELVQYATEVLEQKGVIFKLQTPIKACYPDRVELASGETILTQTVVWTGGVRGNGIIEKSGFEVVRGRVQVDEYLRAPHYENVFIVGDGALLFNKANGKAYPPTAQIAIQQGESCARNLYALVSGNSGNLKKFIPQIRGTVASLGKGQAVGIIKDKKVYGSSASLLKKIIDHRYLYRLGGVSLLMKKSHLISH